MKDVLSPDLSLDDLKLQLAAIAKDQDHPCAQAIRALERMTWQPMETAPRGNGEGNADTTDPDYIAPPRILLRFGEEGIAIAYWDWYYAEGGWGFTDGFAWIEPFSGEPLNLHYSTEPDGWMELPE